MPHARAACILSDSFVQRATCSLISDTSTVCPSTNATTLDAACPGSTKNSTNWVDAAGLADLIAAGATEHCSTGGSVRMALVAIMFFLLVPIPFLLKCLSSTPTLSSKACSKPLNSRSHSKQVRKPARSVEGSRRICPQRARLRSGGA